MAKAQCCHATKVLFKNRRIDSVICFIFPPLKIEKEMNPDKGMREYLETNDIPYRTWAYPDNIDGLGEFLNTTRIIDRRGLYDYRMSSRVHTIAASGVGGGSLVYTNVTEEPDQSVIDSWDTQLNLGINYSNLSSGKRVYRSKQDCNNSSNGQQ